MLLGIYLRAGTRELFRIVVIATKQIPGVSSLLASTLKSEAASFIRTTKLASTNGTATGASVAVTLPKKGIPRDELLQQMKEMKEKEVDHMDGKVFAYAYTLTDDHFELQKDVYDLFTEKIGHSPEHDSLVKIFQRSFLHENALNPMVYPSLRRMETEVVSMTSAMLHGDVSCAGFLTSGGTESLLMAVKTYRDRARALAPWIVTPEIPVHGKVNSGCSGPQSSPGAGGVSRTRDTRAPADPLGEEGREGGGKRGGVMSAIHCATNASSLPSGTIAANLSALKSSYFFRVASLSQSMVQKPRPVAQLEVTL
ncbi:sphingosine-1-phosphate lyase [Plakobranchus ocellatus]|uniref:Sphingosine-1-phosphate lyase n=1 Tax=Plakobranchus ocellatus TaxID=259542 RepID=A0AAV4B026_9GAST|nr:sphingosine-1-phosphate lyase [Plakobranchus ocellatus]